MKSRIASRLSTNVPLWQGPGGPGRRRRGRPARRGRRSPLRIRLTHYPGIMIAAIGSENHLEVEGDLARILPTETDRELTDDIDPFDIP